jgi:uncharacterized membrane protein HdeD (DUF308 family)
MQLEEDMVAREASKWWWVFLLVGILWLLIGFVVLRLDITSVATVGFLIGGLFLVAALNEIMEGSASSGGWKLLHYFLAVVFILGMIWAFARPGDAVFALASVLGLLLFLMGTFEIVRAVATKDVNELWWMMLIVGILEILLAMWVSQRYYPARIQLILIWVGFMAIFRGIAQITMAFVIRKAGKELAAA